MFVVIVSIASIFMTSWWWQWSILVILIISSDLKPGTWYSLQLTAHNGAGSRVVTTQFATLSVTGDVNDDPDDVEQWFSLQSTSGQTLLPRIGSTPGTRLDQVGDRHYHHCNCHHLLHKVIVQPGWWKHCLADHLCHNCHFHPAFGWRLCLQKEKVTKIQKFSSDPYFHFDLQVSWTGSVRRIHPGQLRVLREVFDGAGCSAGQPSRATRQERRRARRDENSSLQSALTEPAKQGWPPWQQEWRVEPVLVVAVRHLQEAGTQRPSLLPSHCQWFLPPLSNFWSSRVLCSALSHQLNVKTGPADVPDHGRRFWKWLGGGVPGSNQHNPTECDSDGFEPANLLHLDPAATSPSCHKSLRQQGKVGRDQVLHHHPLYIPQHHIASQSAPLIFPQDLLPGSLCLRMCS